MILREIQIENFRQITGAHTIYLAQPGEKSLTIILGENGSGKTTFLHACLWCFYDRRDFDNPDELVSYRALALSNGKPVTVRVCVTFDSGEGRYIAERSMSVRLETDGTRLKSEPEFSLSYTDSRGESRSIPNPQHEIQRILPKDLAGFFFFRGEDLEQLVARSGEDKLKTAVEEFIDLILLDRAIAHLTAVEKELEQQMRKQTSGRTLELSEQINEIDTRLDELAVQDERARGEESQLQLQKEQVENDLRKYQEIQPLVDRKRELDVMIADADKSVASASAELAQIISRSGFLRLNPEILTKSARLAEEAVEKGQLPAKIKPQFVNDLLDRGECICGRELGPYERSVLSEWRNANQLAAIELAISTLRSDVNHMKTRADEFEGDYERLRDRLDQLRSERKQFIDERSRIETELEGGELGVDVSKLQALLSDINEQLMTLSGDKGARTNQRQMLEEERDKLNKARNKELKVEEKAKLTSRRIGATHNVIAAIKKIRDGWVKLVQEYVDKELTRNWKTMAQLDRKVEFDENFNLSIHERDGSGSWVRSAPSSANQRALALGFVTSLIRLAAEAGAKTDKSDFFLGGDYPLVMDAPFATMDDHFKRTIPVGLRKIVRQLVLVSSRDQWEGIVQEVLEGSIGRIYVLELHGPEVESTSIELNGREVEYKVREPGEPYDWTIIREIEI